MTVANSVPMHVLLSLCKRYLKKNFFVWSLLKDGRTYGMYG